MQRDDSSRSELPDAPAARLDESPVAQEGWSRLLQEASPADVPEVLHAYSESMPPPRLGMKPTGVAETAHQKPGDDHGWRVTEYEEHLELRPGLERVARHVLQELSELGHGVRSQISRSLVHRNAAFPERLASADAALAKETFALALPVALSKTQDERGRVRWTFFGGSHEGPGRAFWKSFADTASHGNGEALFRRWAAWALRVPESSLEDLAAGGLRVLPADPDPDLPAFGWEPIPEFARRLLLTDEEPLADLAIVTFRLFENLPRRVQEAYLAGGVRLLPCPQSLVFWGHAGYRRLAQTLPRATQIPLLQLFPRTEDAGGFRIPQSGWLDERPDDAADSADGGRSEHAMRRRVRRPHRWELDDDGKTDLMLDDRVTVALVSSHPDDLHLYGKPMAKTAQVWTEKYERVLDGATATSKDIEAAAELFKQAGRFGYRFQFPPMRVGSREIFWHRPLLARMGTDGEPEIFSWSGIDGFLTAEREGAAPIELWPRIEEREEHLEAVALAEAEDVAPRVRGTATRNARKLLEWPRLLGAPLTPALARSLIAAPRDASLEEWLAVATPRLAKAIRSRIGEAPPGDDAPLTLAQTATREFEERWWRCVSDLSEKDLITKNNADLVIANEGRKKPTVGGSAPHAPEKKAVRDDGDRGAEAPEGEREGRPEADRARTNGERDLDLVGELLHKWHAERIRAHGLEGAAVCADHTFRWETFFDYSWSKGWQRSAKGAAGERNVIVVIPGRDRTKAAILADHYDTAYMEDCYYPARGGTFWRAAAAGADDNASATATLQLAADVFLPLAKAGRLEHDVWLVHFTGEEFPADCLGARALATRLAKKDLVLRTRGGRKVDLSGVEAVGAIVLDMIAHNAERARDVFQIATGDGAGAARLARTVHEANLAWNRIAAERNQAPERKKAGRFERQPNGLGEPPAFRHLPLTGEIRPQWDPRSALYNTDAQILSDMGIPAVLLMENYEIFRTGYHDSEDTMANIDLDYGAAMAAIAIESIARLVVR